VLCDAWHHWIVSLFFLKTPFFLKWLRSKHINEERIQQHVVNASGMWIALNDVLTLDTLHGVVWIWNALINKLTKGMPRTLFFHLFHTAGL
jgi:hypothetical protein